MRRLFTNRLMLAMLCIIIGMAPLVAFINTIESGKHMLKKEFNAGNSTLVGIELEGSTALYDDFVKLSEEMPELNGIMPISTNNITISSYKDDSIVTLKAVDGSFEKYAGIEIVKGKFITKGSLDNNANVIVIDDLTADELFGTTEVLGRTVEMQIEGTSFEAAIIGICKRLDISEEQPDNKKGVAYIPITMLDSNLMNYNLQYALLNVKDLQLDETKARVSHFLKDRGIQVDSDGIKLINQVKLIDAFASKNLALILAMAVLWLVVAVIGLINIMLVDIERSKKYYGLLRFYGNTGSRIRNQVYGKAYIISLISAAFSIAVGMLASFAVCQLINVPFYISIHSSALGMLLPIALCMSASIYPARRASSIDVNSTIWQLD